MSIESLKERLDKAKAELARLRLKALREDLNYSDTFEARRLAGKIEGVDLALSYLREEQ